MWRVLIADDHPLFRRGVVSAINELAHWTVVAEASNGIDAIRAIHEHAPDVAILDVSMPGVDGLEVLSQARTWPTRPEFVMLTMHDDYVSKALKCGALGYLLKEDAISEIEACLCLVVEGERYLSARLRAEASMTGQLAAAEIERLSATERRVLRLVAQHLTSREISSLISVSHRTIQNHRANMVRKLGLAGTSALLKFALLHKDDLDRT